MSDVVDPKINPEQAAQQVIIEIIRAGKSGGFFGAGTKPSTDALLTIFQSIVNHYKKLD
ncbi:hypothetical protein [Morganella psychrotolerans]|uniref:hypothetical protein n=1 Tax=Morganella psychrotolerans TaxID=368603 RepID=UPI0012EAB79F|nr:hypothetical protein [Morganella psychrotolerans]